MNDDRLRQRIPLQQALKAFPRHRPLSIAATEPLVLSVAVSVIHLAAGKASAADSETSGCSSQQQFHEKASAFPPTGRGRGPLSRLLGKAFAFPREGFRLPFGTTRTLRLRSAPSCPAFVSFAGAVPRCIAGFAPCGGRCAGRRARTFGVADVPRRHLDAWRAEDLSSSRTDPLAVPLVFLRPRKNRVELALSLHPTRPRDWATPAASSMGFFRGSITRLGGSLSTLHSAGSPRRHARLASGRAATLYRTGFAPAGSALKGFSYVSVVTCRSPFASLT